MQKYFLILLGLICLILAIIGIFLPLLPTTPLLLFSSYLFLKSSKKLYNWLIGHKIFGQYIIDYQKDKSVPLKIKAFSISILWISILSSIIFFTEKLWLRILLLVIAIGVSIHILKLKTKR